MRDGVEGIVLACVAAVLVDVVAAGVAPTSKPNAPTNNPPGAVGEPWCGDPVGVFSGDACETAEDLRVACPDIDLVAFRAYTSGSMYEGPLGFGWTHAYGKVGPGPVSGDDFCVNVAVFWELTI